jgi:hypothetical protein
MPEAAKIVVQKPHLPTTSRNKPGKSPKRLKRQQMLVIFASRVAWLGTDYPRALVAVGLPIPRGNEARLFKMRWGSS